MLALLDNNQEVVTMSSGVIAGTTSDETWSDSCDENPNKGDIVPQFMCSVWDQAREGAALT
jgi:hypothetical protein